MDMNIRKKDVFSYLVMPQLVGRFKDLFATGFQYIPFFVALVYQCVRILPANHPYVRAENIGQFGIRHVIAEAANNITVKRENIDQIILFAMILLGLGILGMQMFMTVFGVFTQPAFAQAADGVARFFSIPHPEHDLVYMFLDMVFGLPSNMFGSCVSLADVACQDYSYSGSSDRQMLPHYPTPAHVGLHQMFQIYSMGLLVVAVFITLYFITTIIAETAQTGTPMGKRFNKVWAPIRLVVAFGLLIPIGSGLNSAQWIVLNSAKFGSNFATNGWILFNKTLSGTENSNGVAQDGYRKAVHGQLIARPNTPEVGTLLQFMYTARACYEAHKAQNPDLYKSSVSEEDKLKQVHPYLVSSKNSLLATENHQRIETPDGFNPLTYDGGSSGDLQQIKDALPYEEMIAFAQGRNTVKLRFGIRNQKTYAIHPGNVFPSCGELTINLEDPRPAEIDSDKKASALKGPTIIQQYYWFVIKELWFTNAVFDEHVNYPKSHITDATVTNKDGENLVEENNKLIIPKPDGDLTTSLQKFYSRDLNYIITGDGYGNFLNEDGNTDGAVEAQNWDARWQVDDELIKRGWGGAAIWYNKIAEMNGPITGAVLGVPSPTKYPAIMEYVKVKKSRYEKSVQAQERFKPVLATGEAIDFQNIDKGMTNAQDLYEAFSYWEVTGFASTSHSDATGNPVIDVINAILGTDGLFNMRKNQDVHALAQVVGIGKGLVDSSIGNLGKAGVISLGGAALSKVIGADFPAGFASTVSGFMITVTMIGLTAGFILFYIVPFLPFIYFFFALGGWIKGIFEAMVGAPLWALAHLRIDGEGLSGKDAASGYYLIFEIFLRPILVIFGFLASITTFSAIVSVLNDIFTLVTDNLTGFDVADADAGWTDIEKYRGTIDEFFYTVVYAIIVYLTGMASFKLIDQIPNSILRWMGQSVQTFNDSREDPAEKMVSTATIGSQQAFEKIGGGLGTLNKSIEQIGKS